jgi:opacity protein-like surface antigen
MKRAIPIVVLLSCLPLVAQTYVAAGGSVGSAEAVTLVDSDCGSIQPPALFGCGEGSDGRSLAARGELRHGRGFELAVGRKSGRARAELLWSSRSGLKLDAGSNFTGVTGDQPVRARVKSQSLLLVGAFDLAPKSWRLRPFIAAGGGVARNSIGDITFAFPGISSAAVTITRGGDATEFAWSGSAGVTIEFGAGFEVDAAMRYVDLGRIRGERGEATIVRPTRTFRLEIGETEMQWRTREVSVLLRRTF